MYAHGIIISGGVESSNAIHNSLCSPRCILSVVEYLHRVMVGVAKELTHYSTLEPESQGNG